MKVLYDVFDVLAPPIPIIERRTRKRKGEEPFSQDPDCCSVFDILPPRKLHIFLFNEIHFITFIIIIPIYISNLPLQSFLNHTFISL